MNVYSYNGYHSSLDHFWFGSNSASAEEVEELINQIDNFGQPVSLFWNCPIISQKMSSDNLLNMLKECNIETMTIVSKLPKRWFNNVKSLSKLLTLPSKKFQIQGVFLEEQHIEIICQAMTGLNNPITISFNEVDINEQVLGSFLRNLWVYPSQLSIVTFRRPFGIFNQNCDSLGQFQAWNGNPNGLFKACEKLSKSKWVLSVLALCSSRCVKRIGSKSSLTKIPLPLFQELVKFIIGRV